MSAEEWNAKYPPVTIDQAREAALRLINAAFRNEDRPRPRFSIPARPDEDDDLVVLRFIQAQQVVSLASRPARPTVSDGADQPM